MKRRVIAGVILVVLLLVAICALSFPINSTPMNSSMEQWQFADIVWFGDSTVPATQPSEVREAFGDAHVSIFALPAADCVAWIHALRYAAKEYPASFVGKTVIMTVNMPVMSEYFQSHDVHRTWVVSAAALAGGPIDRARFRLEALRPTSRGGRMGCEERVRLCFLGPCVQEPLDCLRECALLCRGLGARFVVYSTPIEHEWCKQVVGEEFDASMADRLKAVRAALDGTGAEFIDMTYLLNDDQFAHDQDYPTGHMTPAGKVSVITRLAADILHRTD